MGKFNINIEKVTHTLKLLQLCNVIETKCNGLNTGVVSYLELLTDCSELNLKDNKDIEYWMVECVNNGLISGSMNQEDASATIRYGI